jgi:hypothetical protein
MNQEENTYEPSSRLEKTPVRNISAIKTSQTANRNTTRLSLKILMIGQLKKRTPSMKRKIKTSVRIRQPPRFEK